jgi:hypothetical protein
MVTQHPSYAARLQAAEDDGAGAAAASHMQARAMRGLLLQVVA